MPTRLSHRTTTRTARSAGKASAAQQGARPARKRAPSEKHEDRLTLILKTAAHLFAEHGYEATSLDTIADQMGMHKATLYHYVSGKEQILFMCQLRSFADIEEVYATAQDTSLPVLERLRFFAVHLAHAQHSEFGRCLVMVGAKPLAEAAGGQIRQFQRRLDTIVRDLLTEGMASGELRQADPALCGAMLFGALNWVPRWFKPEGRYSVDDVANFFFDILADGIRAGDKPAVTPPTRRRPSTAAARSRKG